MTSATPRPRQAIVGRMTRYAIECRVDEAVTVVGFTCRRSRLVLLRAAQAQAGALLPFLTDADTCHYRAGVLTLGARVSLRFGATERQS